MFLLVTGLLGTTELGAQSIIFQLSSIFYMVSHYVYLYTICKHIYYILLYILYYIILLLLLCITIYYNDEAPEEYGSPVKKHAFANMVSNKKVMLY